MHTLHAASVSDWTDEEIYRLLYNGNQTKAPDTYTIWNNNPKLDHVRIY